MDFFDQTDYKKIVREWIESKEHGKRGSYREIAEHLRISTALVSQIFKGSRDLTLEQGWELTEFMKLTELQTRYFVTLIQIERAGSQKLKQYYQDLLEILRTDAKKIKNRVGPDKSLNPSAQAIFYSHWSYSAIRLLTAIKEFDSTSKIAKRLNLPINHVNRVLKFLLQEGLVVQENGKLAMGPRKTHLPAESEYIIQRHAGWRLKALEQMPEANPNNLFFTNTVTLSKKDMEQIRKLILKLIEQVDQVVLPSESEELCCLNIDLFKV